MSQIDQSPRVGDDPILKSLMDGIVQRIRERVPEPQTEALIAFARAYLRRPPDDQFFQLPIEQLYAQVKGLFDFASSRGLEPSVVRPFNPSIETDGYETIGAVLEANVDDSPFLVDSISEEIQGRDISVHRVLHPVVGVERDDAGQITNIHHARGAEHRESIMHFEMDRPLQGEELESLRVAVLRVLTDVRLTVRDFSAMRRKVAALVELAHSATALYEHDEIEETVAFIEWLLQDNFVFLGYREYALLDTPKGRAIAVVPDSGLGIMSDTSASGFAVPVPLSSVAQALRTRLEGGDLLVVTKTNSNSTVHRRAKMDYVGIRRVAPDGTLLGEVRVVGLFTSKAYMEPASRTPMLHRKLTQILEAEDLFEGSHDHKKVISLFESFPKDELFAAPTEEIRRQVMGLVNLQESRGIAVFVRRDLVDRSVSILVALPRERFNAELRHKLQDLFMERFHGTSIDYHLALGEADPAQIHFTLWVSSGQLPDVSISELEKEVVALTRTWDDRLAEVLASRVGLERARALTERWARRFPDYYRTSENFNLIAGDIEQLERLAASSESFVVGLQNERGLRENLTRIALYKKDGKAQLSAVVPILEALGLRVVEEVPVRILGEGGMFIHDFGVVDRAGRQLDLTSVGENVAGAFAAVWRGEAESDSLNRLVLIAGLTYKEIGVLRAYRTYGSRVSAGFTEEYMNDTFVKHPDVSAMLVRLFSLRFHPDGPLEEETEPLKRDILKALERVTSLDEDRILRDHLGYLEATVRTNAFKPDRDCLSLKLRSADVPNMPKPYPLYEIFVWASGVEAIHLRGGMVARGGLRWSDRKEDYRTEILGLMKAQMTKNAVIVPTGSKGGFVLRHPPLDPSLMKDEVRHQYVTFMHGLLDLTDNWVEGRVVHPPHVRVRDVDDTYLVVAADKGTATMSDTANGVAEEYGYWLGDAFASGGSRGYDHKALGITARGAWESVKRHFRELDIDVATHPFTVAGIGDMSGDVFGNGMLLSEQIKLVAAFDHRHVFLDPDPDPAAGFAERKRLFDLGPGTTWENYDASLISEGGGVYPRTAKKIQVSEQVREALGIATDAATMTPNQLLAAILRAPVDLLWNGGIGTYVKASEESNAEVGDRANDAIRASGIELRCRVVGEGGNLGVTQRGRIEYASAGGRINTDFIDNAAGVDCSDHEVNLKILLGMAEERGELTRQERDALILEVSGDVVDHVLYDNFLQAQILSQEQEASAERLEGYEELMRSLEAEGMLERAVEFLPSSEEMAERARDGRGMARPELAVLLAYAKRSLSGALLDSNIPDSPYLEDDLRAYFPPKVVERFGHLIAEHPLQRELVATIEANDLVNSVGITFVSRQIAETGAAASDVARAYRIARDVTGAVGRWDAIEALVGELDPETTNHLLEGVDWLVAAVARWYLPRATDQHLADAVAASRASFSELSDALPEIGPDAWRADRTATVKWLVETGVPEDVARRHAYQGELAHGPDIIAISHATGHSVRDVARVFFLLGDMFRIDWLEARLEELPTDSHWQRWAAQAMEDDLFLVRRQLAERVLGASGGLPPEEATDAYISERQVAYERLMRFMTQLGAQGVNDLATLTVAIRQIRAFVV